MKSQIWQTATGVLASALITGLGCWMAFGQNKVSRQELTEYVQNQSPWVRDRGELIAAVRSNQTTLQTVLAAQQELVIAQHVLVTQVNRLLDKN